MSNRRDNRIAAVIWKDNNGGAAGTSRLEGVAGHRLTPRSSDHAVSLLDPDPAEIRPGARDLDGSKPAFKV